MIADLRQRKRLHSLRPLSHPSSASFNRNEDLLAVKSTWGEIALLNVEDGEKLTSTRPKRQEEGPGAHFSSTGDFLVDGSWPGKIRIRQTSDLAVVETFTYKGQMIGSVSPSADADIWLFKHTIKRRDSEEDGPPPYLSIWRWPLKEPESIILTGLDVLNEAALSPCASYIAARGYSRAAQAWELRILQRNGTVLATHPIEIGGSGWSLRWSPDSKLVGAVAKGAFIVLSAPDWKLHTKIPEQYPSDLAFIGQNTEIVLGSWTEGRIVDLSLHEI